MQQFLDIVSDHRQRLAALYDSEAQDDQKRVQKAAIIADLKATHEALKANWHGKSRYDAWFAQDINNAQLNAVAAYFELAPALELLLQQLDGDLQAFYTEAIRLAGLNREERHTRLGGADSSGINQRFPGHEDVDSTLHELRKLSAYYSIQQNIGKLNSQLSQ